MSIVIITKENFDEEVIKSKVPVLIDFWADWCNPCKMMSPIIDEIDQEGDGSYKVCKINIDEQMELASQFRIMNIPTLVIFKGKKLMDKLIGVQSKEDVLSMLGKYK